MFLFRCWARYRQLVPLLDKQLPEDVSPLLGERFQGFSQHHLDTLTSWRKTVLRLSNQLQTIKTFCREVKGIQDGEVYTAAEYRAVLQGLMLNLNSVVLVLQHFNQDYPEIKESSSTLALAKTTLAHASSYSSTAPTYFVSTARFEQLSGLRSKVEKLAEEIQTCSTLVSKQPVEQRLQATQTKVGEVLSLLSSPKLCQKLSPLDPKVQKGLGKTLFKSLLGIQSMLKNLNSFKEEDSWLHKMKEMVEAVPKYKCLSLVRDLESCVKMFALVPESRLELFTVLSDVVQMLDVYRCSLESILNSCMLVSREFSKLLSVILKIFRTIAVQGFCPIKGFEDEEKQSGETDFKSTEEETGLGQGDGNKDVSDQIDNEDMLDGAYDGTEKEEEQKDHQEEENGIEMSENFESKLQDKKEEERENDEERDDNDEDKDIDDEVGEVEGNEELDKEMWGDQEEEEDEENLGESKEQGNTEEEVSEDLSSNDKQDAKKDEEKRQRKDEEPEEPEFDDNQVDDIHGEDKKFPEPEQMDLPDEMAMEVDEQEDPFEDNDGENEPDALPDFEDKVEDKNEEEDSNDEEGEDGDNTQVEKFEEDDTPDEETVEKAEEDQKLKMDEEELEKGPDETVANEENKTGKDSVKNETDLDQSNKEESAGMNENSEDQEDNKSFSVVSDKKSKEDTEDKSGRGTKAEQEKTLADESLKGERLELLEGNMTGEEGQKNADTFQHVMDQREEDKAALDRTDETVKEQVFLNDFEMEAPEEDEEEANKREESRPDKSVAEKTEDGSASDEKGEKEKSEKDGEKDFIETASIPRGTDSVVVRQEMNVLPAGSFARFETDLSLQQITLSDSEENNAPVLTQLSHQLSEQLRLILTPTKAANLQGDFRTGKRLNMRKIIPFIASDFKKDKIWLRRTKPNKREFQILVALDDSSSMSDNKSRQIALESLNTISSALALLEAGQIGVLRFGAAAEVIHPLNVQWSQAAGNKIQNQFR